MAVKTKQPDRFITFSVIIIVLLTTITTFSELSLTFDNIFAQRGEEKGEEYKNEK